MTSYVQGLIVKDRVEVGRGGINPIVGSEQGWLESLRTAKTVHDLWAFPVCNMGSRTGEHRLKALRSVLCETSHTQLDS